MKCPKCLTENKEGAKFCKKCGGKLELLCPACGHAYEADSLFCSECGRQLSLPSKQTTKELSFDEKIRKIQKYLPSGLTEKILAQRDRIEGERKQVTVMFCDMEGFTPLVEKLGPEEAYALLDKVLEILIHKVHDYEGTVNKMTGDGIMALLGLPSRWRMPRREPSGLLMPSTGRWLSLVTGSGKRKVYCRSRCGLGSTRARW